MPIERPKKHTAQVSLVVSVVFHTLIIGALVFLAAREGYLGKQLKTIAVTMAPKEEKPPAPKEPERPPEPRPEPPKVAEPTPQPAVKPPTAPLTTANTAPPPAVAPAAAPPPADIAGFNFSDGAKVVETSSDPVQLYRGFVEFSLRSKWRRPEGVADDDYVAEVELSLNPSGRVVSSVWKRGSGHAAWDASVREAVAASPVFSRPPPAKFPERFTVRFDVVQESDPNALVTP